MYKQASHPHGSDAGAIRWKAYAIYIKTNTDAKPCTHRLRIENINAVISILTQTIEIRDLVFMKCQTLIVSIKKQH